MLPDGRRQITGFVGPEHFLGLAISEHYAFTAEAITTVRYCLFPRARMTALLEDFPLMERRLLGRASNELAAAQEQMLLLGRKTARERLASFLVAQSKQGAACQIAQTRFDLPMIRDDIGGYLGVTVETVSRNFTLLRRQKIIETPSLRSVVILNRKALEMVAAGVTT
jgi:CRP/FNR family transcriptional regulator